MSSLDVTGLDEAGTGSATVTGPRVGPTPAPSRAPSNTYAALDLGTNNCRLLVARPSHYGFKIVDAFSRIVRLGEGVSQTGRLGEAAMGRTMAALEICRDKMRTRGVNRARLIATEACRMAENGPSFIAEVQERLGMELEIVDRETEAHLAAAGCYTLVDQDADSALLFDIGGGSSEIVWLSRGTGGAQNDMRERVRTWASLQLGVVTLAEKFGGYDVDQQTYEAMVDHVSGELDDFLARTRGEGRCSRFHLLGTSGTVTTIAGVHLGLARYDRRRVDGLWMSDREVHRAIRRLRNMTYDDRVANGCIGAERADLVLAGCAIFDAIRRAFPAQRIRIADRGLREGILMQLMTADQAWNGNIAGQGHAG